ncbi:MAG: efflux RND transporter permease subunit [Aeromicrobium sp.]
MSRLTQLSLANRVVVLSLALLTVIVGISSARALKQELIPSLEWPASTIISIYPGASPTSVESEVSKPIETAVEAVDGVKSVTSVSSSNTSQVTVEWEYGEDADQVMADIRSAIDGIDLPSTVDPEISSGSFDDLPILIAAVSSDTGPQELSTQVDDVIVPALKEVDGVQDITVAGAEEREIDITFDTRRVNDRGVDPTTVRQLFEANSRAVPSGTMRTDRSDIDVQTGRTYETADHIENLEVQGEDGPIRLGRLATVEEQPTDTTTISRVNGRDAITLSVVKNADANTVAVARGVNAVFDDLTKELGNGTEFNAVFDQAPFIEQSIHDLSLEGGIGLLMAVLVILLFLRSMGPTIISGISIPLSLLVAMIALLVSDNTLNILTLGALTVAIGRVVDDSIVVIENIKRHQGLGETGYGTLVTSVKEVAGAVTSSTLTTVAVFLPVGLVSGQTGELFRPFALTVTVALLASLVISLTVVPVLASYLMQRAVNVDEAKAQAHDEADGALQHAYLPVLRWSLAHRLITVALAIGLFVGTMALVPFLKTDFIGAASEVSLQVNQTLPTGTSLKETDAAARKVESVIARDPNLDTYSTTIGGGSSIFVTVKNDSNKATSTVLLKPGVNPLTAAKELRADLAKLDDVGKLQVAIGDSETSSKVVLYVESPDQDKLDTATEEALDMMEGVEGLTNITSDLGEERDMLDVAVDSPRAANLGMTQAGIGQAVAWAVSGEKIGEMTQGDTTLDVYLRSQEPAKELTEVRRIVLPVSQKMTMDAREDALDDVEARQDAFAADAKADAEDEFHDSVDDLKDERSKAKKSTRQLHHQLAAARGRLRDLQRALAQAQQNPDPVVVGQNVFAISLQISAVSQQIAQLSQGLAASQGSADGMSDQIESMTDQYQKQVESQNDQDALADAAEAAQEVDANAIRLDDVATVDMVRAASTITRVDGARAVTITAASEGKDLSATTAAIQTGLTKLDLDDGVTVRLGGVSEQQEEAFGQLGIAMLVAIAIVYLIMVATFGSLIQPLILLVSIPFAATGALGLSLITDTAIGVPSMIGLLMLIGIVVTNAIVLIDLINQKRKGGADVEESIMAGARLRVRPIVMTALATIGALIPMGLGLTGGGVFISKPLAIVVIGGLISSSILTLILVPVLYDLVERRPDWMRRSKPQPVTE